jgi:hypothetical protein
LIFIRKDNLRKAEKKGPKGILTPLGAFIMDPSGKSTS